MEARDVWEKKAEPASFAEFVTAREQAGEDLLLHKEGWTKNNNSPICQLCSGGFGLTVRRHHCRYMCVFVGVFFYGRLLKYVFVGECVFYGLCVCRQHQLVPNSTRLL